MSRDLVPLGGGRFSLRLLAAQAVIVLSEIGPSRLLRERRPPGRRRPTPTAFFYLHPASLPPPDGYDHVAMLRGWHTVDDVLDAIRETPLSP